MIKSPEQLDEMIRRVQQHKDVSAWQRDNAGSVNLVSIMANIPKAELPKPNLLRIKTKILDRISLPAEMDSNKTVMEMGVLRFIPRFLRLTGGIVGGFTILLSLTFGTAVAALESTPGQTIYPLKKMVESVQLGLTFSQEEKANLQIKFAHNRVSELETVLQKQKEGKATQAEVQKAVESTSKDLEKSTQAAADQSTEQTQVDLFAKIVTLSDKQTAVIQAAQLQTEGTVKIELEKALELSKTTKEQAIEKIEEAGVTPETVVTPPIDPTAALDKNTVLAEGALTAINTTSISIGTSQFLLTKDTQYANIIREDLKLEMVVKVTGKITDGKTYAVKIEAEPKTEETPTPPAPNETETEDTTSETTSPAGATEPQ